MSRAPLMYEHFDVGVRLHQRTGRARVIQMDMGQQDATDVPDRYPLLSERLGERIECRGWARIDDGHTASIFEDGRRDDAGTPEKIEIDVIHAACKCAHA